MYMCVSDCAHSFQIMEVAEFIAEKSIFFN